MWSKMLAIAFSLIFIDCVTCIGHTEQHHETAKPVPDFCQTNPCGPNAKCISRGKIFHCSCPVGYEGTPLVNCTKKDPCQPNPCSINAKCQVHGSGAHCKCPPGYEGNPLVNCIQKDPCLPNPCGLNAKCEAHGSGAHCKCPPGYEGNPLVNCTQKDPCLPNPCGLNAKCEAHGIGVVNCDCFIGYEVNPLGNCIQVSCLPPFKKLPQTNECFFVSKEQLTWDEARGACQKIGGDLAVPKDLSALHTLLSTIPPKEVCNRCSWFYVGGNDRASHHMTERKHSWINNGGVVTGVTWFGNNPNLDKEDNCLLINHADGKLADSATGCGSTVAEGWNTGYICQKSFR